LSPAAVLLEALIVLERIVSVPATSIAPPNVNGPPPLAWQLVMVARSSTRLPDERMQLARPCV